MAVSKSTIVLITGANQGIGLETARKLASENEGYHILMGARDPAKGQKAASELQKEGLSVEPIEIDILSDESISKAAQWVKDTYGRLDVLINNAGILPFGIENLREFYRTAYETNTISQAAVTEAFIPLLEQAKQLPRIVFLSSNLGSLKYKAGGTHQTAEVDFPQYRASKAALNMVMLTYADKYKQKGWKINSVCPGYVATNINGYSGPGTAKDGAVQPSKLATIGADGPTGTYSSNLDTDMGW